MQDFMSEATIQRLIDLQGEISEVMSKVDSIRAYFMSNYEPGIYDGEWRVKAKDGKNKYMLKFYPDGTYSCTCKSYHYSKINACKHGEAIKIMNEVPTWPMNIDKNKILKINDIHIKIMMRFYQVHAVGPEFAITSRSLITGARREENELAWHYDQTIRGRMTELRKHGYLKVKGDIEPEERAPPDSLYYLAQKSRDLVIAEIMKGGEST